MEKSKVIPGPLLAKVNSSSDLKKLSLNQLPQLCKELRTFMIETLADNPGHFGASLGTVEITVALHYVFDTPNDRIVWDVGHQAYGHKILTGRRDQFHTNRKYKGISGFPKIEESEYDTFGVGHSSTSISATLGMAVASDLKGEYNRKHIAVIGDGAMSGGEAFEGLNNAGVSKSDLLVILNDNGISIDKGVGALQEYLFRLTTHPAYNKMKDKTWTALGILGTTGPSPRNIISRMGLATKRFFLKDSEYTESLNMRYFGPVNGHDVIKLVKTYRKVKDISGPKMLHVVTKKGKGFVKAEEDQITYHAPGKFDSETGELKKSASTGKTPPKYQDVFGETLMELAEKNDRIVAITPAMPSGSSLVNMMKKMPNRAFDVGIAEQHAVTYAAGLATQGMIPYCAIYSTFLQRAFDQVIHDVALQNLNVVIPIDRGGLVGEDGPTHHGAFDLAYLRLIPNIIIAAPMDEIELRQLLYTAQLKEHGAFAIRFPRGAGEHIEWKKDFEEIEIGKGRWLSKTGKIAIVTIGKAGNFAQAAISQLKVEGMDAAHLDMRFLKPFDTEKVSELLANYDTIITVEDGTIEGGLGSLIAEQIVAGGQNNKLLKLGIPDRFIQHGKPEELYAECGFDADSIAMEVKALLTS